MELSSVLGEHNEEEDGDEAGLLQQRQSKITGLQASPLKEVLSWYMARMRRREME